MGSEGEGEEGWVGAGGREAEARSVSFDYG